MAEPVTLWVGTRKGAFVMRSKNRRRWEIEGPHFRGSEVNAIAQDPRDPKRVLAAVTSAWFGPHIHASNNGGKTWKLSERGLELKSIRNESLKRGLADPPRPRRRAEDRLCGRRSGRAVPQRR